MVKNYLYGKYIWESPVNEYPGIGLIEWTTDILKTIDYKDARALYLYNRLLGKEEAERYGLELIGSRRGFTI